MQLPKWVIRRQSLGATPPVQRGASFIAVQRLFSTFPVGLPGVALLLLRLSVTVSLLLSIPGYDLHGPRQALAVLIVAALSTCLCLGFLTPLVSLLPMADVLSHPASMEWGRFAALVALLDACALAMLGPGAYSIDGYRFGRRLDVDDWTPS
jgi:hypothetical protein